MISRTALTLLALLSLTACGKSDPPPEFAGPASPALFEISASDGEVEGWLFGTIHSLPDGVEWRTERLDAALESADLLVVEVRDLDDAEALRRAFDDRAYAEGLPPIADRVPGELRSALRDLLVEHAVPADTLSRMETWAAALTLAQYAKSGKATNGVDRALLREIPPARVVELEGTGPQLDIFDTLPETEQRDLLASVIADIAVQGDRPAGHAANWYAGEIAHLADPATSAILADPELRAALHGDRNRAWAEWLGAMLSAAPRPFVAVGAAHIAGEDGLAALLAERGYSVRRIQ